MSGGGTENIRPATLKYDVFELKMSHPGPILRDRRLCDQAHILCLAELLEWYGVQGDDDDDNPRDIDLIRA